MRKGLEFAPQQMPGTQSQLSGLVGGRGDRELLEWGLNSGTSDPEPRTQPLHDTHTHTHTHTRTQHNNHTLSPSLLVPIHTQLLLADSSRVSNTLHTSCMEGSSWLLPTIGDWST